MTTAYKIRNKDGLFSSGGASVYWNPVGKLWISKPRISRHLSQHMLGDRKRSWNTYDGTEEIVEYELNEVAAEGLGAFLALKELNSIAGKRRAMNDAVKIERLSAQKVEIERQLKELKK